jgi:hypothetical protein
MSSSSDVLSLIIQSLILSSPFMIVHTPVFSIAVNAAMIHLHCIDVSDPSSINGLIVSVVPDGSLYSRHFLMSRFLHFVRDLRPSTVCPQFGFIDIQQSIP